MKNHIMKNHIMKKHIRKILTNIVCGIVTVTLVSCTAADWEGVGQVLEQANKNLAQQNAGHGNSSSRSYAPRYSSTSGDYSTSSLLTYDTSPSKPYRQQNGIATSSKWGESKSKYVKRADGTSGYEFYQYNREAGKFQRTPEDDVGFEN